MKQYTNARNTNIMKLHTASTPAMYTYRKPNIRNCKCTFADGSEYFQKVIANDKRYDFIGESNKLYIDQECTLLAPVTRKQKIKECKKRGLI